MPPRPVKDKLPACGFYVSVNETDQSLPIKIKKVAKGKKLSILSGITGSRTAAVNTLKQMLGVGGEVSTDTPNAIELQGDQTGRLQTILRNLGALKGETCSNGPIVVVPPKQGYEKFMKQKDSASSAPSLPEEMSQACVLVHGRYWPYCNGNCQFCPPLTDVFEGLDMYCSWYEPDSIPLSERKKDGTQSDVPMTKQELDAALGHLGMQAEVGQAIRTYQEEKRRKPWLFEKKSSEEKQKPVVESIAPPPVRRAPKRPAFVDRPVRVILNRLEEEDSEWYVMELTLKDPSMWMSDYESFITSLLSETSVDLAHHELVDSRTLKLLFTTKHMMLGCGEVLEEVMPSFFIVKTRDASNPIEEEPAQDVDSDSSCPPLDFEGMAIEFGMDTNEDFWRSFTELVEESDGSQDGLMHAFQTAILRVT
jgi:translation initiation factor 1 (eIF-1/SUI1)